MAWLVKAPVSKPDNLSLIPGTGVVEGEPRKEGRKGASLHKQAMQYAPLPDMHR